MKTKVQFQVKDGKSTLSILNDTGSIDVDLSGTTDDGTPRIARLAEKLAKAADKADSGSDYRYALNI